MQKTLQSPPAARPRTLLSSTLLLASLLVLAACGGGGGGGGGGDSTPPPPPPPPPPPASYAVSVSVSGNGTLSTASGSINCGTLCSTTVTADTQVTLVATPGAGQVLQSWGGACSGASGTTCTLTVRQATTASATFVAAPPVSFPLTVTVSGNGTLRSAPAGIDCGSSCNASFAASASVTLTATPAQGSTLQAWGGACSSTPASSATCTVTMSEARSASVTFAVISQPSKAWGTALALESSNDFNVAGTNVFGDASLVSAIDPSGNALVIWEQSDGTPDGSTRKVFSRRYVAGQGWAAAVQVPGMTASSSSVALVTGRAVMDAAGNAIWVRHNFETRRFSPTSGWSSTAFVPPAAGGGELADLVIDAGGALHMLGIGSNDVLYSRLPASSNAWSAWSDVSQTDLATRYAQLALGAQGSLIAIWRERNPGDSNDSMKANRLVSGNWQTPVRIEEVLTDVHDSQVRLASDQAGNALAVWHQGGSIYANRFDAATATWGTPTQLDTNQVSSTFAARIELAMAPDGRAVFVWNSGIFALKSATFTPGSGFSAPATVNTYSAHNFVAIDRNGRATVVYRAPSQWPNPTDGTQNLYARDLPWGGAWGNAVLLEAGNGDVKAGIACDSNAEGEAFCSWAQDDLPNETIRNSLWGNLRR